MECKRFKCGNFTIYCIQIEIKRENTITASSSGDCKALDRNSDILPSFKLFICKQRDCKGVLKISGS